MIFLNEDSSELKMQLDNLEKILPTVSSSLEAYDYVVSYNFLREYFNKPTIFTRKNIALLTFFGKEYFHNLVTLKYNFRINRNYHNKFLIDASKAVRNVYQTIKQEYTSLGYKDYRILGGKKDIELLNEFFLEEDPTLKDIFDDMRKAKRIYYDKKSQLPYSFYNFFDGIPSIFLHPRQKNKWTLEDSDSLIHELGHIKAEIDIYNQNPKKALQYSAYSLYQEVMPYYYEQKFLDFLVENNIQKREAKDIFYDNLDLLVDSFDECRGLDKWIFDCDDLLKNIQYCYGPVIASYLVKYPETKESFFKFQYDIFHPSKLEEIGFTTEIATVAMENKAKTYFKLKS